MKDLYREFKGWIIGIVITIIMVVVIVVAWLLMTTSGQDAITDFQSDVSGLERDIEVLTQFGESLGTYSGENVRMGYSKEGRIQITLDNGERVQISNAIVIVEEPHGGSADDNGE